MLSLLAMEPKKIKNIAFDLGGVVLALSLEGGIKGFEDRTQFPEIKLLCEKID